MGIYYHPPQPFMGRMQPLEKRKFTPSIAAAVASALHAIRIWGTEWYRN